MEKKISLLKEKGLFKIVEINKLGHGSFMQEDKKKNEKIKKALEIKNRAKKEEEYLEGVYFYIKGCLEEEKNVSRIESIGNWKNLNKYITDILRNIKDSPLDNNDTSLHSNENVKDTLKSILFNTKFYMLHLESSLMLKQHENGKEKLKGSLLYFMQEYNGLHELFYKNTNYEGMKVVHPKDLIK